jgi:hypothetical protein
MALTKAKRQDLFPNYMSWAITQTGADQYTTDKIFTPIPRNQVLTGNRAIVMELLWLDVVINNLSLNAADEDITVGIQTGATPVAAASIDSGNMLAMIKIEFSEHTTGAAITIQPLRYMMQSTDGYGQLLATDAFHAWIDGNNTGVTLQGKFRLYYRFVQIPVIEFIGIVQSQQTS